MFRASRDRGLGSFLAAICRLTGTFSLAVCLVAPLQSASLEYRIASWWNPELKSIDQRLATIHGEMQVLPRIPDMDALGSYGFHSNFTSGSEENWFAISWPEPRAIDGIALIPTRLTTQSGNTSNYGFPNRIRVEAITPGSDAAVVIAELADTRLDSRRGEPVFFEIPHTEVRSLRFIPIDLPYLSGKQVRFFSVSEVMVFQGDRNIAPDGDLSAPFSIDAEVGWNIRYLTDGQSSLGPPVVPPAALSLGWHADSLPNTTTWAAIDLGADHRFDAVRIVPAYADALVKGPGFGFPVAFSIDVKDDSDDTDWKTVWNSGEEPFSNPGYNPVILRFPPVTARHVRLFVSRQHQPDRFTAPRVLLSELEVLDGLTNLALGKPVTTTDTTPSKPHDGRRIWSAEGLTDGHSSTGRLIPLRSWVKDLSLRFDLSLERSALLAGREAILRRSFRRTLVATFTVLVAAIVVLFIWQIRIQLAARHRIRDLRRRISSDLHDEVGSNLATIALLAEIKPLNDGGERFADIGRMARESSLSLREIVDLTLAPKRARKPLPERLREIASLMLKEHTWEFTADTAPNLDPEQRRNLVYFLKEALHNVSRHAQAGHVAIHFESNASQAMLSVSDDGCGLPDPPPGGQPRLPALEQRAASLHGSLTIETSPGNGTSLILRFPLRAPTS